MPRSEDSTGRQTPSTTFGQARNQRKGQEAEHQAHLHPFQSSQLPADDFSGFLPIIYAGIKAAKAAPAVFIPPPQKNKQHFTWGKAPGLGRRQWGWAQAGLVQSSSRGRRMKMAWDCPRDTQTRKQPSVPFADIFLTLP